MIKLRENQINLNKIHIVGIADVLLVYTMLAPIIFLIIGEYTKLAPNFIRTLIVLLGPGLAAGAIYLKLCGFRVLTRSKWIILCMMIFTLIYIFSCIKHLGTEAARESLKFFVGWCVFGFCLGTISNMSISRSQRFYIIWLAFIIGILVYAIYQQWPNLNRRFDLSGINNAQIGTLFYFFALCVLFKFDSSMKLVARIALLTLLLACFIIGFYSGTRTAFFGFLISFVIYLFCYYHHKLNIIYPIIIVCFVIIVSIILLPNVNKLIKKRYVKAFEDAKNVISYVFSGDLTAYNSTIRIRIWKTAIDEFKKKPVLGSGIGIFYHDENLDKDFVHPHNIILELLAETGAVGFGAFVVLFSLITMRAVSNYKKLDSENRMTFLFFPLSLLFFFLYSSLHTDLSTEYFKWYFAGMITGFDIQ